MTQHVTQHVEPDREVAMLRSELEMLMGERRALLHAVGAAAVFVAVMDSHSLPPDSYESADKLAIAINGLPEETLRDALELVRADGDAPDGDAPGGKAA